MIEKNSKVEIGIPGVDFAQMAREAIAGQLTQAMAATQEMIQRIVTSALTQKVDSEGKARSGYGGDKSFIEWVTEDMVRKAVIEMFKVRVEELRPAIERAVLAEMKRSAPAIAKALVASVRRERQPLVEHEGRVSDCSEVEVVRVKPHSHPCQKCGMETECGGTYEANEDGWPPAICPEFHLSGGVINPDFLCLACAEGVPA